MWSKMQSLETAREGLYKEDNSFFLIYYFIHHYVCGVNSIISERNQDTLKICRVELYTELFYAIIPTLFLCFALICYPYISLHY